MTPVSGSFIPAATGTLPDNNVWLETKYIVYKQADPALSPYLDPAATLPFFSFNDI